MGDQDRELTVAHVDAERGFSGGEFQVFLLMEGLRSRGHRNVLFCPPGSRAEAEARSRDFEVVPVPMHGDLDLVAVLRLRRRFRQGDLDLVHLHTGRATWLGGLAAGWCGVPAITTRRQDRRVKRNWRTRLLYGRLVRRAVAISPAVARCLAEGGVPPACTLTIPSAVDPGILSESTDREHRAELRRGEGIEADDFVLLTLAALVHRKGIDVLLEALAGASAEPEADPPRIVLLIAGEGEERTALERRSRELELESRVRFLGLRSDRSQLLALCDATVLPSRREGLGVASLESMAAARPVIASRVGGLAEAVVDGRTGLLVEPEDRGALLGAIQRLAGDPDLCKRLGQAGPERIAEGYLPEQMVEAYERLYHEVLSEEERS